MYGNANISDPRNSNSSGFGGNREIPSFIEPRPPLITNPWMRPKPTHGTNLLPLFEDTVIDEEIDPEYVKVYLRIKPTNENISDVYQIQSDQSLLTVAAEKNSKLDVKVSKMYFFSHIFDRDATQKHIFDNIVKQNLAQLPKGYNHTLLTYGSSGSGKTYTLMGTVTQPGLIPRSLEYLFKNLNPSKYPIWKPKDGSVFEKLTQSQQLQELQVHSKLRRPQPAAQTYRRMSVRLSSDFQSLSNINSGENHSVWVSFAEIYNESIYDLLSAREKFKAPIRLRICEDTKGNANIKGLTQVYVRTGAEAYDVMLHGQQNLKFAETGVHSHSSRSHCIFTVTLITHTEGGQPSLSCLRLCDLAGSERASKTGNSGERMQESRSINMSLHVLERCLHMLRRKQHNTTQSYSKGNDTTVGRNTSNVLAKGNVIVPYRESKLTRLLGSSLSGASGESIAMVVNINPQRRYFEETQHVLQLSAIARKLIVDPCVQDIDVGNSVSATESDCGYNYAMEKLKHENERLHFENDRLHRELEEESTRVITLQSEHGKQLYELLQESNDICKSTHEAECQLLKEIHDRKIEEYQKKLRQWKRKYRCLSRSKNKRSTLSEGEEFDLSQMSDGSDGSLDDSYDYNEEKIESLQRKVAEQADIIQQLRESNRLLTEDKKKAAIFEQDAEDLCVKLVYLEEEHEKLQRCYDEVEAQLMQQQVANNGSNKSNSENVSENCETVNSNKPDKAHDDEISEGTNSSMEAGNVDLEDNVNIEDNVDILNRDSYGMGKEDIIFVANKEEVVMLDESDEIFLDEDSKIRISSLSLANQSKISTEAADSQENSLVDAVNDITSERNVLSNNFIDIVSEHSSKYSQDTSPPGELNRSETGDIGNCTEAEVGSLRKTSIGASCNKNSDQIDEEHILSSQSEIDTNQRSECVIVNHKCRSLETHRSSKRSSTLNEDHLDFLESRKSLGKISEINESLHTNEEESENCSHDNCDPLNTTNKIDLNESDTRNTSAVDDPHNTEIHSVCPDSSDQLLNICDALSKSQIHENNVKDSTVDRKSHIENNIMIVESEFDFEESIVLEHKDVSIEHVDHVDENEAMSQDSNADKEEDKECSKLHNDSGLDCSEDTEVKFKEQNISEKHSTLKDLTNCSTAPEESKTNVTPEKRNLEPLWKGAKTTGRAERSSIHDENKLPTFQTEKKLKRRQLWTPRVCDEDTLVVTDGVVGVAGLVGGGEESPMERLVVPRPSYHQPRRTRRNKKV